MLKWKESVPWWGLKTGAKGQEEDFKNAAALLPAVTPLENAHCKLNPPQGPSISIISPQKNSPLHLRLIRLLDSISLRVTPPEVTIAAEKSPVPIAISGIPSNISCSSLLLLSRVTSAALTSG